ncbi:unnamed protein product, partial [Allacma fusca]
QAAGLHWSVILWRSAVNRLDEG